MPRKKISKEPEIIDGIPDLEENEQVVIENRRTIRKEKSKPPEPILSPEPDIIEIDEEDETDDTPRFSQTSIAAGIFNEADEFGRDQFCTVLVRRNPDSMNDRFVNPNSAVLNLQPLRNIDITAERADIEDIVRNTHGGGHYFFQIHYGGQLRYSWKSSLADTPEQKRAALHPKEAIVEQPAPIEKPEPVNPFDQFFDALQKQKQMKDLLFGDEKRQLEDEIRRLKDEVANRPQPAPQSETLAILEKAISAGNPSLQEKLFDIAFPPKDESNSHWIVELAKTVFEHKEELAGVAQMVFGGLAGPRPQQNIEALLRSQPPAGLNAPATASSAFRRRQISPTPAEQAETIDGEIEPQQTDEHEQSDSNVE